MYAYQNEQSVRALCERARECTCVRGRASDIESVSEVREREGARAREMGRESERARGRKGEMCIADSCKFL